MYIPILPFFFTMYPSVEREEVLQYVLCVLYVVPLQRALDMYNASSISTNAVRVLLTKIPLLKFYHFFLKCSYWLCDLTHFWEFLFVAFQSFIFSCTHHLTFNNKLKTNININANTYKSTNAIAPLIREVEIGPLM